MPLLIREFIQWAGWTMTDYLETPAPTVEEWWSVWETWVEHQNTQKPS